ncbi:MAG: hypothetical protein U1F45_06765 [Burkholderiales bacterium]
MSGAPGTACPPTPALPPPAPALAAVIVPSAEAEESRQAADCSQARQRVAQLGADDQRKELGTATQAFNRERTHFNRVRLGLLYALPGAAIQDDPRALSLLEPIAGGPGALKGLAGLVYAQVAERVKLQKRADQYREQLDQLRAVERSIIERGQQSQPKKP